MVLSSPLKKPQELHKTWICLWLLFFLYLYIFYKSFQIYWIFTKSDKIFQKKGKAKIFALEKILICCSIPVPALGLRFPPGASVPFLILNSSICVSILFLLLTLHLLFHHTFQHTILLHLFPKSWFSFPLEKHHSLKLYSYLFLKPCLLLDSPDTLLPPGSDLCCLLATLHPSPSRPDWMPLAGCPWPQLFTLLLTAKHLPYH